MGLDFCKKCGYYLKPNHTCIITNDGKKEANLVGTARILQNVKGKNNNWLNNSTVMVKLDTGVHLQIPMAGLLYGNRIAPVRQFTPITQPKGLPMVTPQD